ncbi:MAG TPA: APC family permease [Acidimicrobiia bacterium]
MEHELLPKRLALPVFASDPLSSVAYATEESMLVLALAGAAAFSYLTPISIAIALLLLIVVISYRQTIRAYPQGGGAFNVALENLGLTPAMVAAAALLADYTLTVSVSVAAGMAAVTSAFPSLLPYRVLMSVVVIGLITVANLRGARESSTFFALPTYAFVVTVFAMLATGFARCALDACPQAISAGAELPAEVATVSIFLILRAFASGSTALTGVEAISNGVQAFRAPKARNAAHTLAVMGAISIAMFLGISTLARLFDVRISEETVDTYGTVISQIGRAAFNEGFGFWLLQVFTALILVLAANTAYQDFPRLSAILARNKLMPRQFRNLGDRLVFSNGVLVLAGAAVLLIVIFDAEVSRLIQLYVVGVFISFTISQTGMVRRWWRTKEPGWRRSWPVNAVGAVVTGIVLVVIATVKFSHGAWIVLVAIPVLVLIMAATRRHYLDVADRLRLVGEGPIPTRNRVVVLVAHTGRATERAIEYAELIQPDAITIVHAPETRNEDLIDTWPRLYPQHPLEVVESEGRTFQSLRRFVSREAEAYPDSFITVVIPELIRHQRLGSLVTHPHGLVLKLLLLFIPRVAVTDLTYQRPRAGSTNIAKRDPDHIATQEVVVLVSDVAVHTRRALAYAARLGGQMRAAHLDIDADQRNKILANWHETFGPLEILESPFRGITKPLLRYVRRLRRDTDPGTLINVVIPEFVVPGFGSQILHNQTAFYIKATLIFEPGVAVTSVPWHLASAEADALAATFEESAQGD